MSSNRTFMELKYSRIFVDKSSETRSNRTFMELKFAGLAAPIVGGLVLIVPLWN